MSRGSKRVSASPQDVEDIAQRLASELYSRFQLGEISSNDSAIDYASRLVTATYSGERDLYQTFGYKRKLEYADYDLRFKRGGITRRLIADIPLYGLGQGVHVYEDPDPKTQTKFETSVDELVARTKLWEKLYRVSVQARIGRYSALFIGSVSDPKSPDKTLETELNRMRGPQDITYFTPIPENRAKILSTVERHNDPRFGLPEYYQINFHGKRSSNVKVHWSRIIHCVENPIDFDYLSSPVLEQSWNLFDDLMKLIGGGAEGAYQRADARMMFEMDPNIKLRQQEKDEMAADLDKFQHGKLRYLRTRGVTAHQFSTNPYDFSSNVDCVMQQIAGTHHLPMRWLLGSEIGELASSQDQENLFHFIKSWQQVVARSRAEELFRRLIRYGALPAIPELFIEFPDVSDLSELTRAELLFKLTEANSAQKAAGQPVVFTTAELRDRVYDIQDEESDSDEPEIEEEPNQEENLTFAAAVPASSPDIVVVYNIADSRVTGFEVSIDQYFADQQTAIDSIETEVINALETGSIDAVTLAIDQAIWSDYANQVNDLVDDYLGVIGAAGKALSKHVNRRGSWLSDFPENPTTIAAERQASYHRSATAAKLVTFAFDVNNERAIAWARANAATLVQDVNNSVVLALRELTVRGLQDGIAPRVLYKQMRDVVNLRSDQVQAVENLRQRLIKAKPGDTVKAGKLKFKIPRSGGSSLIDKNCAKYADKLRDDRSKLISRTEVNKSANQGQVELWNQAVEAGDLPNDIWVIWFAIVDSRSREEHVAKHGQKKRLNEPWEPPDNPGEKPNCRCGQGLGT